MKNMKRLAAVAVCLVLAASAVPGVRAENEVEIGAWQSDVQLGLNLLQSSYSKNWNGGEKGSVVWTGNLDARFENQFNAKTNWRNTLKLVFGQTHQQERDGSGDLYWKRPDKTDDLVDFESLFRWTPENGWDPFISVNFTSMFQDLTDPYGRSQSLNPKRFKESVGLARTLIDNEDRKLMTRLGAAFIQNSRSFFDETDPASQETQSESSTEAAAEMIAEYSSKVLDGAVHWDSKLSLVLPFSYSGKSSFEDEVDLATAGLPEDLADYTTALDVDWENTFTATITKTISVKLFVRWVYDKYDNSVTPLIGDDGSLANRDAVNSAIRKAGQFKQTMALGFTYKFM
jgi:hypothetical protein